jgi:hypothetical protein
VTRTRDEFREVLARSLTTEIGVDWDADIEDRDKLLALLDRSAMVTYDKLIEEISDQAAALRERNRLYGRASATIGRLRADVARLRLERAEWRGTVNGDVLVEVLAASAPEQWTPEDRRRHAEHVIEAMQASGIEVCRTIKTRRIEFTREQLAEVEYWSKTPMPGGDR